LKSHVHLSPLNFPTRRSSDLYMVETAANGAEGVMMVLRGRPDLVVLDLHMPVMDGLQALKQLRNIDTRVPVMVITASRDSKAAADRKSTRLNSSHDQISYAVF